MREAWLLGVAAVAALAAGRAAADEAEKTKWAAHVGDLPFVIGFEKGMAEVKFTGRPPMYFFTATW